jgi:rhamnosyl/mannosyltransferase
MRFLWDNPIIAAEMGKRAELRYWELFTAERMASSYAALYKELLTEKNA